MSRKASPTNQEQDEILDEVEKEHFSSHKCNHVNKQHVNSDGILEDLLCSLEEAHEGDHSAEYKCLRLVDGSIAQSKLIAAGTPVLKLSGKMVQGSGFVKNEYLEVTERAYWSNAASVPADQVKPDLEQLAHIKANKGNMLDEAQVLRNQENPL
jgi:hypothetical protein